MTHRKKITRFVSLLVAAALVGLVIYLTGWENIRSLRIVNPIALFLSAAAFTCVILVTSFRWRFITQLLTGQPTASLGLYYHYMVTMRFLGLISTQSIGDLVIRPLFLWKGDEVSLERALISSFVDKCFDLAFATFFLALAATIAFKLESAGIVAAALVAIICLVFIFRMNRLVHTGRSWVAKGVGAVSRWMDPEKTFGNWLNRLGAKLTEGKEIPPIPFKEASIALGITAVRLSLLASFFWLLSIACGLNFPFHIIFLCLPVVQFTSSVPLTPGSLGVSEIGWVGALTALGHSPVEAGSFAIAARVFFTLLILVLAGISNLAFPQYRARLLKKPDQAKESEETQ